MTEQVVVCAMISLEDITVIDGLTNKLGCVEAIS